MRRSLAAVALVPVLLAALAAASTRPSLGQEPFPTPPGQLGGPERLDPTPDFPTPPPPSPSPAASPTPAPSPLPTPAATPTPTPTEAGSTGTLPELTVEEVVARVGPAVVTVVPAAVGGGGGGGAPIRPAAVASGVFIDDSGHVLTVASVAARAAEFDVYLSSGEARRGRLVGVDDLTGVALLRVDGPVSAFVPPADSVALRPGQEIVALGSALTTLRGTVTTGVVSLPDRALPWATIPFGVVQHSAPVVLGMEGGPLLDRSGNLVGLLVDPLTLLPVPFPDPALDDSVAGVIGLPSTPTAAIDRPDPISDPPARALGGLSFAVPSSTVTRVVLDLLDDGRVNYPFLGVAVAPPETVDPTGSGRAEGALVLDVEPGGPAAAAGIRIDDRLLAIAGERIGPDRSLVDVLFTFRPGDAVDLVVLRGGDELTLQAILAERPTQ